MTKNILRAITLIIILVTVLYVYTKPPQFLHEPLRNWCIKYQVLHCQNLEIWGCHSDFGGNKLHCHQAGPEDSEIMFPSYEANNTCLVDSDAKCSANHWH